MIFVIVVLDVFSKTKTFSLESVSDTDSLSVCHTQLHLCVSSILKSVSLNTVIAVTVTVWLH